MPGLASTTGAAPVSASSWACCRTGVDNACARSGGNTTLRGAEVAAAGVTAFLWCDRCTLALWLTKRRSVGGGTVSESSLVMSLVSSSDSDTSSGMGRVSLTSFIWAVAVGWRSGCVMALGIAGRRDAKERFTRGCLGTAGRTAFESSLAMSLVSSHELVSELEQRSGSDPELEWRSGTPSLPWSSCVTAWGCGDTRKALLLDKRISRAPARSCGDLAGNPGLDVRQRELGASGHRGTWKVQVSLLGREDVVLDCVEGPRPERWCLPSPGRVRRACARCVRDSSAKSPWWGATPASCIPITGEE